MEGVISRKLDADCFSIATMRHGRTSDRRRTSVEALGMPSELATLRRPAR
jgi:hypothetical protein